jgi:hypothetical protein
MVNKKNRIFRLNQKVKQSVILEGKRSRKPTLRLEISEFLPAKKELSIPQVSHRTDE